MDTTQEYAFESPARTRALGDRRLGAVSSSARQDLSAFASRVAREDLLPYAPALTGDPAATASFRRAAVLALFTPSATASQVVRPLAEPSKPPATSTPPSSSAPPSSPPPQPSPPPHRLGTDIFLVQRSPQLRHHPGQIALPGGSIEAGDATSRAAALRETEEETGIDPSQVEILGELPPAAVPISSFLVTPVLGWASDIPPLQTPAQDEVLYALRVSVDELLDPASRATVVMAGRNSPGFKIATGWVWGFTGILLDSLFTQLSWTQPWDPSVRYEMSFDEARGR